MTGTTIEAAGVKEILEALPHRYPFLMVDRIINIRGDESGVGIKNVTINEPQFMGHFPGNPVFPGVLMIEGMAQTAGVICILAEAMAAGCPIIAVDTPQARDVLGGGALFVENDATHLALALERMSVPTAELREIVERGAGQSGRLW